MTADKKTHFQLQLMPKAPNNCFTPALLSWICWYQSKYEKEVKRWSNRESRRLVLGQLQQLVATVPVTFCLSRFRLTFQRSWSPPWTSQRLWLRAVMQPPSGSGGAALLEWRKSHQQRQRERARRPYAGRWDLWTVTDRHTRLLSNSGHLNIQDSSKWGLFIIIFIEKSKCGNEKFFHLYVSLYTRPKRPTNALHRYTCYV